jgi:hypothetical protein
MKVFSKNRVVTVTKPNASGGMDKVSEKTQEVVGTNYGLGEILGKGNISESSRMNTPLTMTNDGTWRTTGEDIYYGTKPMALASLLGISDTNSNGIISYDEILNKAQGVTNTAVTVSADKISYTEASGRRVEFVFADALNGSKIIESAKINGETRTTLAYGSGNGSAG